MAQYLLVENVSIVANKWLKRVQTWSKYGEKLSSSRLHLVLIRKSTVLKVNNDLLSGCRTQRQGSRSGHNSAVAILRPTSLAAVLRGKTNSIVAFSFHPVCLGNLSPTP